MTRITQREWESEDHTGTPEQLGGFLFSFVMIGGLWFGAIFTWSAGLGMSSLPFIIAGAIVGGFLGFISGAVVASQTSRLRAREMQAGASLSLIPLAILVTLVGLVVWLLRTVI